jgi:putative ABC transport system substrate-binding protein
MVALLAFTLNSPLCAQPAKTPRIGWLSPDREFLGPVALDELRRLGWVDGKNIVVEQRYADGNLGKLPDFVGDLVGLKVDVIVTFGGGVAVAKRATQTIPIVMATSQDPVRTAFAASLARPGGNITGITYLTDQLAEKRLELTKQMVPSLRRAAVVWEPAHIDNEFKGLETAAPLLGVQVHSIEVPRPVRPDEVRRVVQAALQAKADALILAPGGFTIFQRKALIAEAAKHRLPVFSAWGIFADDGAVLTYGPNPIEMSRRLASYVDRVLRGAKPAALPIEQPSQFELVVNARAAKALGIAVPSPLLQRAERVIE